MKKVIVAIRRILLSLVILICVLLLSVYGYNRFMLSKEEGLLVNNPGELIEVDGHHMNLLEEGTGDHTIVFLSGSGTASPLLDFKPLSRQLQSEYRTVTIEKFGYGFSDITDTERSFDTILNEDREVLKKAGIEGPYILCPHSMSGLEAILWAQKYPEEVEAIIGLDMSLPEGYAKMNFRQVSMNMKLAEAARHLGLVRLYYSDDSMSDALSDQDKALYRAIACRIAVNTDVQNECKAIPDAIKETESMQMPEVPTLQFVSDGSETGVDDWIQIHRNYTDAIENSKLIELDCGHYVQDHKYREIAAGIQTFVKSYLN